MDSAWLLAVVGAALAVGAALGWWAANRRRGEHQHEPPPPKVPDRVTPAGLGVELKARLGGASFTTDGGTTPSQLVWVDGGDEVLVHVDSLTTRALDGALLVSVDLETDQTGRQPLVVVLSMAAADDGAGLVAVTEDVPRGDPVLAARWGAALQNAVWAALTALARAHADERAGAPRALVVTADGLRLVAGAPLRVVPGGGAPT